METHKPITTSTRNALDLKAVGLLALPVILLASIIALFLATDGAGLRVEPAAPIEAVTFERTVLRPGVIEFHITNNSPQEITIAAVNINDAIWSFEAMPGRTIPRLGHAHITVSYDWVKGEPYQVTLFSANSISFETRIEAAAETVVPTGKSFLSFTLIGLYVGVIPVFLGLFWFPALRKLGPRWMMFLMAITAGLLIFLGMDATNEALEQAQQVGGPFQGVGLAGVGIVVTFLLLDAISRRQATTGRSDADQRLTVAFMIAVGIGLHNLGEGLAIGAAYSVGAAALGTFLVIGFMIQNITEGLGILVPVLKDKPALGRLALMGLIGGAPAIVGAWIGGLIYSQVMAVLFLAIGGGAVFEVVYEIAKLIQKDMAKRPMPLTIFSGVTAGMLILYVAGVLIK